ncbi:MAG: hypothetical protein M3367_16055 [Acidobacteriota bacterium]|nr:hypothetical protein [Acidobacteriota bacterium]
MEGKKLKKRLAKIPDADKSGEPIYKIATVKTSDNQSDNKPRNVEKRGSK